MGFAAGKFPDQPAVDGAEQQFALACALAAAFDVVEDPLQFGAGEVRVGYQASGVADVLLVAVALELFANFGTATALPDDGVVDRATAFLVPDHSGLTLVGNADGGNLVVMQAGLGQGLDHDRALGGEDFHRVVFDPARLRVVLLEFALRRTHHVGVTIKDDRSRTGGALVQRNNVVLILNIGNLEVPCRMREVAGARQVTGSRSWAPRFMIGCQDAWVFTCAAVSVAAAAGATSGKWRAISPR